MIEGVKIDILPDGGSGIPSISGDLGEEFQEDVSGCTQLTRSFEGQVGVRTGFGHELIIMTQTLLFTGTVDTDWGRSPSFRRQWCSWKRETICLSGNKLL